jgi:hypothetical protein
MELSETNTFRIFSLSKNYCGSLLECIKHQDTVTTVHLLSLFVVVAFPAEPTLTHRGLPSKLIIAGGSYLVWVLVVGLASGVSSPLDVLGSVRLGVRFQNCGWIEQVPLC